MFGLNYINGCFTAYHQFKIFGKEQNYYLLIADRCLLLQINKNKWAWIL